MDALPRPPKWRRYLRFLRADVAADVDDELAFHLEARTEELVATGLSREAATAQALVEMGDLLQVRKGLEAIDRRASDRRSRLEWWRALGIDVRYALRRLRYSPGFTIAATLTLAIAIGATTSVFGLVDGVLLKAFPYRDPDRVLTLWESNILQNFPKVTVSAGDYVDWRAQNRVFSGLAGAWPRDFTVIGRQESEYVQGFSVTPNYFSVLGISPVLGRVLSSDSLGPAEVVISYGLWLRRFGGSRTALGQSLRLASPIWSTDSLYTVVGVMPPGLPGPSELWTRLRLTPRMVVGHQGSELQVYGRLMPGVTPEAAQTEMTTIAQRIAVADPEMRKNWTVLTIPLPDQLVGDVRPALVMLLSAAACVLLIGAANLANLFLVRCLARQRELAVRTALGATRNRLMRELLVEAATLGIGAGAIGVAGASAGVRVLRGLAPPTLPRLSGIGVDSRLVAFCTIISLATVFIVGALPAWQASGSNVADYLKEGGRGTGSARSHRLQDGLVVLQVAVALVLLTGAGLLVESFIHFARMDPGFRPDGVLTARITLDPERYATAERENAFFSSVAERLAAQPGVDAAGIGEPPPGNPANPLPIPFIGDPPFDPARVDWNHFDWAHARTAGLVEASPGYLRAIGIRLLRGRPLLPNDDMRAPHVALVDEQLARHFFAGRDAIGERLAIWCLSPPCPSVLEVVGIVATVKQGGLAAEDAPEMYVPIAQYPALSATIALHTNGDPEALAGMLRRVISNLDPSVPVFDIQTMNQRLGRSVGVARFSAFLASLFAIVALVLGTIGIYSVLAYIVSQRQREIGVRIALGASHANVIGDVVRRTAALTGAGIVVGSGAAWVLTRALASIFLGVSPHDPRIFMGAVATFAVVALSAASVPAFRTTRVNPVVALTST